MKTKSEGQQMRSQLCLSSPASFFLILFFGLGFMVSCASYLEKNLDIESKEFLSKVRYIITKQERKDFLRLLPEKRDEFIEEFWKRRDPNPSTEANEFKEQYFRRIEEANKLFKGVPAGWLQDRGRVYILVGPPDSRIQYPMGRYSRPYEVWRYGFFPVYFVDWSQSGEYELTPLSAQQIAEITKAQSLEGKPMRPYSEKAPLDFNVQLKKGHRNEVLVYVDVPYQNIWFVEKEGRLETLLELTVEIFNSENQKVKEHMKEYKVLLTEKAVKKGGNYPIQIPFVLSKGKYTMHFTLYNKTDEATQKKKIDVKI